MGRGIAALCALSGYETHVFEADAAASAICYALDQMFFMRPVAGYGRYATPIRKLYLCGSGAHPGGGVMGAPGHNAAMKILEDGV